MLLALAGDELGGVGLVDDRHLAKRTVVRSIGDRFGFDAAGGQEEGGCEKERGLMHVDSHSESGVRASTGHQ